MPCLLSLLRRVTLVAAGAPPFLPLRPVLQLPCFTPALPVCPRRFLSALRPFFRSSQVLFLRIPFFSAASLPEPPRVLCSSSFPWHVTHLRSLPPRYCRSLASLVLVLLPSRARRLSSPPTALVRSSRFALPFGAGGGAAVPRRPCAFHWSPSFLGTSTASRAPSASYSLNM